MLPMPIYTNLIPFLVLTLSTPYSFLKDKLKHLAVGVLILIISHFLLDIGFYNLFRDPVTPKPIYWTFKYPLVLLSEAFPIVLWLILARKNLKRFLPRV